MTCVLPLTTSESKFLTGAEFAHDNAPGRSSDTTETYPSSWKIFFKALKTTKFFDKLDISDIENFSNISDDTSPYVS